MAKRRHFHMHETARQQALEGLPLASFGQRVLGYVVDLVVAVIVWAPLEWAWKKHVLHQHDIDLKWTFMNWEILWCCCSTTVLLIILATDRR